MKTPAPKPAPPSLADQFSQRLAYRSPSPDATDRMVHLRAEARSLAVLIAETVPASREQSLAMTALEESVMWSLKAIAAYADNPEADHHQPNRPRA